ncbi:uncharacterized protein LOC135163558 [Diachasmimorpha longicaudata]|uniref:uncharacterized protein LOC135163558 n=1 Tax=Diachasmimorpha longicaudata TaxID=58733 RepID=UPI0030B8AAF6
MQRPGTMENCNSPFVFQIISVGPRHENEFEVKMLLSEVVDLSTLKITVKSNNLRVGVQCNAPPLETRKSSQREEKHSENFLVPEDFDGDRIRANYDINHRTLIIHAPRRDYYVTK